MEPVTQALLGAAVGQVGFAHRLGYRAVGWGALIGLLPDLDILAASLHGGFGEMVYHRGSTHSLWFGPVVGSAIGWLLWRWRDGAPEHRLAWIGLAVLALFTHPLLDAFTPYGTQLFAPFSRERFAWNGIGIIDPIYTACLVLGVAGGWWSVRKRRLAAALALGVSTAYLGYGVLLNHVAGNDLRETLATDAAPLEIRVYPTLLQPWLRRFVARTPDETRVGLYTMWRRGEPSSSAFANPPADARVDDLLATWEGRTFVWFAMEEITWRVRLDGPYATVEVDDLRYGWPNNRPSEGIWGIRAVYDAEGRRAGPIVRYGRRRNIRVGEVARSLWRATWGDFDRP